MPEHRLRIHTSARRSAQDVASRSAGAARAHHEHAWLPQLQVQRAHRFPHPPHSQVCRLVHGKKGYTGTKVWLAEVLTPAFMNAVCKLYDVLCLARTSGHYPCDDQVRPLARAPHAMSQCRPLDRAPARHRSPIIGRALILCATRAHISDRACTVTPRVALSQNLMYHLSTMIMCMLGNTDQTIEEDAKLVDASRVACTALQHSAYCVVTCAEPTLFDADVRLQAASILCKFDRVQFHTLPESHCSGFASMLDKLLLSAGLFQLQELLISTLQVFAKHSAACTDKLSVLQARYAPLEVDEHASYVAGESKSLGFMSPSARKLLAALNAGDVSSRVLSLQPHAQTNFGEQCAWGSRRDHLGWFDFNLSTMDMNYDLGNQQTCCRRELFLDTELESRVVVEPSSSCSWKRPAERSSWSSMLAKPEQCDSGSVWNWTRSNLQRMDAAWRRTSA